MKKTTFYGVAILFLAGSIFTSCKSKKNVVSTNKSEIVKTLDNVIGGDTGDYIGDIMDKQAKEIRKALPGSKVERIGEGIILTMGENAVGFDSDEATFTMTAKDNLNKLVPIFKKYINTNIVIYGYADSTGTENHNQKLSANRASSVKSYLTQNSINYNRIKTKGLGTKDPIASNETLEGRSKNRRVEFAIFANKEMMKNARKATN
ncbi:outer membrane protein OmpA-like peptidoglycan-associated protein [Lutibacter sp. Hel_I_33_5]|uniref:OmpA family protein n=1 Tax=Lutibacter sp. Hel_I_33_5 TaxID=1566289 RepID=UPI00119E57C7|nr:OmpA family protein [Lutibacter sp. Hel_I_33_5]TVZ54784.1 outer membrane protein OmpA-like peptidoglycan-associated protein [Lutibacter sp. Hel_I_33_5]